MSVSKIAIVVTARPSWAKLLPVCAALRADGYDLDLIAAAYATTHSRGGVLEAMAEDGWPPTTVLHAALDASTEATSALTAGLLLIRLAHHFEQTRPALVIVNHDRHETVAVSIAAAYQNIPLLHLGGGERSGNIDDKVRQANTALADWHAVATEASAARLREAGVPADRVWMTGCPSIDVAAAALAAPPVTADELAHYGTGAALDPRQPFAVVLMHPVTTHPETAAADLAWAIRETYPDLGAGVGNPPVVIFWPGGDTGHDAAAKWLRIHAPANARLLRTLPPRRFLRLLSQATVAVGNSSALVREASYYGTPRLILGDRQQGREGATPPYPGPCTLYGDGHAAPRIAALVRQIVVRRELAE